MYKVTTKNSNCQKYNVCNQSKIYKLLNEEIAKLLPDKESRALKGCRSVVNVSGGYVVGYGETCKRWLLCKACSSKRQKEAVGKFGALNFDVVLTLNFSNEVTIDNYERLKRALRFISTSKTRGKKTEFAKLKSGLYGVQFKGGLHVHILSICKDEIDINKLLEEWVVLGGLNNVHIQKVVDSDRVVSYLYRWENLTKSERVNIYNVVKGKKLFGTFGKLEKAKSTTKKRSRKEQDIRNVETYVWSGDKYVKYVKRYKEAVILIEQVVLWYDYQFARKKEAVVLIEQALFAVQADIIKLSEIIPLINKELQINIRQLNEKN